MRLYILVYFFHFCLWQHSLISLAVHRGGRVKIFKFEVSTGGGGFGLDQAEPPPPLCPVCDWTVGSKFCKMSVAIGCDKTHTQNRHSRVYPHAGKQHNAEKPTVRLVCFLYCNGYPLTGQYYIFQFYFISF